MQYSGGRPLVKSRYYSTTKKMSKMSDNIVYSHPVLFFSDAVKYSVQTRNDPVGLECMMAVFIGVVERRFNVPKATALGFLRHINWRIAYVSELGYGEGPDSNDSNLVLASAHLVKPSQDQSTLPPNTNKQEDKMECSICYTITALVAGECGHTFCRDCWATYLTSKIMDNGFVWNIPCPESDCKIVVTDVTTFISDPLVLTRYESLCRRRDIESFVQNHTRYAFCTNPKCDKVIVLTGQKLPEEVIVQEVVCSCGQSFCFSCGEEWHPPIPCSWLAEWRVDTNSSSLSESWLFHNTKQCLHCKAPIFKDGGCKMICCTQCQSYTCWSCNFKLDDWDKMKEHYHVYCASLPTYNKEPDKDNAKVKEMYKYHYNRALDYGEKVRKGRRWYCPLHRAHQLLMYAWVFQYYVQDNSEWLNYYLGKGITNLEGQVEEVEDVIYRNSNSEPLMEMPHLNLHVKTLRQDLLKYIKQAYQGNLCKMRDNSAM